MEKQQLHSKKHRSLFIGIVVLVVGVIIVLALYIPNYVKPLSMFVNAPTEYKFTISGGPHWVSRKTVKMTTEYSSESNPEYYEKYKKVLMLPLPWYPMSAEQCVELGWGASPKEDIIDTFKSWKLKTVETAKGLSFGIR